jgi:hypothetical protein
MADPATTCLNCAGQGWVCEDHASFPWSDGDGCCGAAGAPCPICNPCDETNPPRMPTDTTIIWDRERGYLN